MANFSRTCYGTKTASLLQLGILLVALCAIIGNGQFVRRPRPRPRPTAAPSVSPAMEAYRQRWQEFLKLRAPAPAAPPASRRPAPVTTYNYNGGGGGGGGGSGLVVNGFQCERTYTVFPNKNNPRMYHLCARARDSMYVYHYFCPLGSVFSDAARKCMQDRNGNGGGYRSTTVRSRQTPKPSTSTTTTETPTTKIALTTTTSTETTMPEVEQTVTEVGPSSSEELSTEEEMGMRDVVVQLPGFTMSASASDEADEVILESGEGSDESNMIPEGDNEPSRLIPVKVSSSSSSPPTEVPQKKKKVTATATATTSPSKTDGSDAADASGGRRPRILKKWRDYISKY